MIYLKQPVNHDGAASLYTYFFMTRMKLGTPPPLSSIIFLTCEIIDVNEMVPFSSSSRNINHLSHFLYFILRHVFDFFPLF